MHTNSLAAFALLALLAVFVRADDRDRTLLASAQDPVPRPAAPPADAPPLRPIEEPYVEPVVRSDLPERYGSRDPIEGVWKVRARAVAGQVAEAGSGLLVVGRRHLVGHFQAPGPDARVPLLRSCAYTWTRTDNTGMVKMVVEFGHFNDSEGDITLESPGQVELRRFELLSDALRVHQGDGGFLEFVRVE